jgi:hypothetical protein
VLLSILTWLVSPVVLGCLAVLLAFWLIVAQGQRARFRREKSKLRSEFDSYRREMQAKARPRRASRAATHMHTQRFTLTTIYPTPNPNGHVQALCKRASSLRLASWRCHALSSTQDIRWSVQRACVRSAEAQPALRAHADGAGMKRSALWRAERREGRAQPRRAAAAPPLAGLAAPPPGAPGRDSVEEGAHRRSRLR